MVYTSVLKTPDSQLSISGTHSKNTYAYVVRRSIHKSGRLSIHNFDISSLDIRILYVSKQIHEESMNVLYTTNDFQFSNARSLKPFLAMIGSRAKLIQSVQLQGCYKVRQKDWASGFRMARELLPKMKNLRALQIDLLFWGQHPSAEQIADDFKPVLTMLMDREKDADKVSKIIGFIKREHCPDHHARDTFVAAEREATLASCAECQAMPANHANLERDLKSSIKSVLEEENDDDEEGKEEPAANARRETGRPKQSAVTKHKKSYAEIEEGVDDDSEFDFD